MIPKEAQLNILRFHLESTVFNMRIRLCQNNPSPADADIGLADLTECTFGGYAEKVTTAFPTPTTNGSNEAESDSATLTWTAVTPSGAQTAYGMYAVFVNAAGSTVLYAFCRFATPKSIVIDGDVIQAGLNMYAFNHAP